MQGGRSSDPGGNFSLLPSPFSFPFSFLHILRPSEWRGSGCGKSREIEQSRKKTIPDDGCMLPFAGQKVVQRVPTPPTHTNEPSGTAMDSSSSPILPACSAPSGRTRRRLPIRGKATIRPGPRSQGGRLTCYPPISLQDYPHDLAAPASTKWTMLIMFQTATT